MTELEQEKYEKALFQNPLTCFYETIFCPTFFIALQERIIITIYLLWLNYSNSLLSRDIQLRFDTQITQPLTSEYMLTFQKAS